MSIEITARHVDVSDDLQNYARDRAEAIKAEFPRIEHLHIILDAEKHRQIAEIVVQAKNHVRVQTKETTDNMKVAIDAATDKVEKQLRRHRDKAQDHHISMKRAERQRVEGEER